ncbi:hypothetical protein NDU88_007386 [Pleurodeles waltl]|uniref:Uncharacterized protein n=1 Tax=Pleurodeles waltl TaxID=8319 RepID=A0AAV7U3G9_PLEWA|nr:hypothetical protein NDU88_007386 [Pleurodeles waltl]
MATTRGLPVNGQADDPTSSAPDTTMDRILQEIMAVTRRLEGMDPNISTLMAETKSIQMNIAGFQNRVMDLQHRISVAEDHLNTLTERDQELLFLQSKVIDLEDRSRRDNIRFFGF